MNEMSNPRDSAALLDAILSSSRSRRREGIGELVDPALERSVCDVVLDELADRASADPAALDAVVAAVYERRFARAAISQYLLIPDDVDDALQEVVLAVTRQIGRYAGDGHFSSWVAGIARHKAIDVLRRRGETASEREAPDEVERFTSQLALRHDVEGAIALLSPDHAQILRLRDIEHRTYQAIAEQLDIEIGTVRSRLARARAQLARLLSSGEDGHQTR